MAKIEVLPHFTASESAWQRAGWLVGVGELPPQPVPESMAGWDYEATLLFQTDTVVDLGRVHRQCRTSGDAVYELICLWDCPATGIRTVGDRKPLQGDDEVSIHSEFRIPRRTVAQRITVERQLVLRQAKTENAEFAPSTPGAVVLREPPDEVKSIALEGSGGRFPVEAMDFAAQHLPEAAWSLSLTYADPGDSFLGSARLYLNSTHPAISKMLADPESAESRQILSVIQWDASRQLLLETAGDKRMIDGPFEDDSVGGVVGRMCASILQREVSSVIALMETDPDRFERLLQDKLRLLRHE